MHERALTLAKIGRVLWRQQQEIYPSLQFNLRNRWSLSDVGEPYYIRAEKAFISYIFQRVLSMHCDMAVSRLPKLAGVSLVRKSFAHEEPQEVVVALQQSAQQAFDLGQVLNLEVLKRQFEALNTRVLFQPVTRSNLLANGSGTVGFMKCNRYVDNIVNQAQLLAVVDECEPFFSAEGMEVIAEELSERERAKKVWNLNVNDEQSPDAAENLTIMKPVPFSKRAR